MNTHTYIQENIPPKTTRKTKTKALWSGQRPHPSHYPLQPRQDSYMAAVHPDMGTTGLPGVPEDTSRVFPSTAPAADTPGFWESFCWELGVGAGTHGAGTSRGH